MPSIVLTTLNARYHHSALGLRYLRANMGALRDDTIIREFVIGARALDIVESLLAESPRIIAFSVYIWNVIETEAIVAALKTVRPGITVILGGPEVSHETQQQHITTLADHVITGWGDVTFPEVAQAILSGQPPAAHIIPGRQPALADIRSPYPEYNDEDLRQRTVYVEASRGCPFRCEFCLSALDKTAWPFDTEAFINDMEMLYRRGLRLYKFVDRTFNLKAETGRRLLDFFLDKLAAAPDDPVFAHFEVIPDHLPDLLKDAIVRFPPGALQFELGLQTLNPHVQKTISRRTDLSKAEANIRWLMRESQAHLHVDLIAGLPGESMASFAAGFDRLWQWGPHEIQLGILKRLRGTPVIRHTDSFGMRYHPLPPYNVLETADVSFMEMQTFARFARHWDIIANAGRFRHTLPLLMQALSSPFASFASLSQHIHTQGGGTHGIALEKLFLFIHDWATTVHNRKSHNDHSDNDTAWLQQMDKALTQDYTRTGLKASWPLLRDGAQGASTPASTQASSPASAPERRSRALKRQQQHQ